MQAGSSSSSPWRGDTPPTPPHPAASASGMLRQDWGRGGDVGQSRPWEPHHSTAQRATIPRRLSRDAGLELQDGQSQVWYGSSGRISSVGATCVVACPALRPCRFAATVGGTTVLTEAVARNGGGPLVLDDDEDDNDDPSGCCVLAAATSRQLCARARSCPLNPPACMCVRASSSLGYDSPKCTQPLRTSPS